MIERLTPELYEKFHGKPPEVDVIGLAITDGDDVLAVGGMAFIEGVDFIMFGMAPEARTRDIIIGWRVLKTMLCADKTYFALKDEEIGAAHGLLTHFGFEHFKDDIYVLVNR